MAVNRVSCDGSDLQRGVDRHVGGDERQSERPRVAVLERSIRLARVPRTGALDHRNVCTRRWAVCLHRASRPAVAPCARMDSSATAPMRPNLDAVHLSSPPGPELKRRSPSPERSSYFRALRWKRALAGCRSWTGPPRRGLAHCRISESLLPGGQSLGESHPSGMGS